MEHAGIAARTLAVVVLLIAVASCSTNTRSPGPERPGADCTTEAADAPALIEAVAEVQPGAVVCVGTRATDDDVDTAGLADADLSVTRGGTADEPVTARGNGATVRSVTVEADHVVIEDFVVADGEGIRLSGTGLLARGNTVRGAQGGGIVCGACIDSTVEDNTVQDTDGIGIWIEGTRIIARGNTVSGSIAREAGDADGMRFFGVGHRITDNVIRDIKEDAVPGSTPHPDCFQTYDDSSPLTFDVIIAGNRCVNVDHQCLIASGDERGNAGVPPGATAIVFTDNDCQIGGGQAVNIRAYSHVTIERNQLSGEYQGVLVVDDSRDIAVVHNVMAGEAPILYADESSLPFVRLDGNTRR